MSSFLKPLKCQLTLLETNEKRHTHKEPSIYSWQSGKKLDERSLLVSQEAGKLAFKICIVKEKKGGLIGSFDHKVSWQQLLKTLHTPQWWQKRVDNYWSSRFFTTLHLSRSSSAPRIGFLRWLNTSFYAAPYKYCQQSCKSSIMRATFEQEFLADNRVHQDIWVTNKGLDLKRSKKQKYFFPSKSIG